MKTVISVDGANLFATAKALRIDVDYSRLLKYYGDDLIQAFYYTAVIEDANSEFSSIRPLIDWLSYNGYTLVQKPAKTFLDPLTGLTKVKGNMDVEIAVDALELSPHYDHFVLFSGDGDFKSLLVALQRKGIYCTVVSSIETQPAMCADELRRIANRFVDLSELAPLLKRPDRKPVLTNKEQLRGRYG